MKKIALYSLIIAVISVLTSCAKRASTPDQALTQAQETYTVMTTRYANVINCPSMGPECLQELRILGVHRERTWLEFFFDWNSQSTPIYRMDSFLRADIQEIESTLQGLRNFGFMHSALYKDLAKVHASLLYVSEQLPVQKDYLDERNTKATHYKLDNLQAQVAHNSLRQSK